MAGGSDGGMALGELGLGNTGPTVAAVLAKWAAVDGAAANLGDDELAAISGAFVAGCIPILVASPATPD